MNEKYPYKSELAFIAQKWEDENSDCHEVNIS